jgi:hypothetical protein
MEASASFCFEEIIVDKDIDGLVAIIVDLLDRRGWRRDEIEAALDVAEAVINDHYDDLARQ